MGKMLTAFVCALVVVVSAPAAGAAATYTVDKAHSSIGFSIMHMMISRVVGQFDDFTGDVQFDPDDPANSKLDFDIEVATINTKNDKRDGHLRGADFFDAEKFPLIIFRSRKIVKKEAGVYDVTGDLTMKGVTKEVTYPVTVLGPVKAPMSGGTALGLEARFSVDRQEYGVNWNKALDNGGLLIGNDVDVVVSIGLEKK